ncbi:MULTISPECIES: hypothetical protein [unclassified Pseudomonas]|uniref:hypothetical protein n=1 Tax=unclassified Pseudomonas TaxID=196821 RepID=UPI00129DDE3F|nr:MULTISPECIES: hypothetical protein [unclassified Pseudomonas]MDH4656146.1 hypothetical protein [Pseudomonas sp. BN606]MRK21245.1 hypothetical protein [Pseudomonas sp. JG-B]
MGGALNCAGVSMGRELLGAAADNKKGYFESKAIQVFHDRRLLPRIGRDWKSVSPLPAAGWESSEAVADLVAEAKEIILDEFGDSALFGIKDPRISLLVPFWMKVFNELGISVCVVIQYRHPIEVAGSLLSRNKTTIEQGVALWLEHVINAERFTRNVPRVFTHYQDLLDDPAAMLQRIAKGLDIEWPSPADETAEKLDKFLEKNLRHQLNVGEQSISELPEIVSRIYSAHMLAISQGCNEDSVLGTFDELNLAYEGSQKFFSDAALLAGLREAELFFDEGEGFSQSRRDSRYFSVDSSERVSLEFDLPRDGVVDVRLDPCSESVIAELCDVELLYDERPAESIKKYIRTNAVYRWGDVYFFAGGDPQIRFKGLAQEHFDGACKVRVSFDVLQSGDRSERIISPVHHLFSEVRKHQKELEEVRVGQEQLKSERDVAVSDKARADVEISRLSGETTALKGRIELFKTKLEQAQEQNANERAASQRLNELVQEKDRSLQLAVDLAKELDLAATEARAAAAAKGAEAEQVKANSQLELAAANDRIAQSMQALRESTEANEQQRMENLRLGGELEAAHQLHQQVTEANQNLINANTVQREELSALNEARVRLSTSLEELQGTHQQGLDANARLKQALAAAQGEAKGTEALLQDSRRESEGRAQQLIQCKDELTLLQKEIDTRERMLQDASLEIQRTRASLHEMTEEADKLRSRLARVGLSRSWRYTRILRKILGKKG